MPHLTDWWFRRWRCRGLRSRSQRLRTAIALGAAGDKRAVDPLIEAIRKAEAKPTRGWVEFVTACVESLGQLSDTRAVPFLIGLCDLSRWPLDPRFGHALAEALGSTGDARALDSLRALSESCRRSVRMAAAAGLSRLGGADAVSPLVSILRRDTSRAMMWHKPEPRRWTSAARRRDAEWHFYDRDDDSVLLRGWGPGVAGTGLRVRLCDLAAADEDYLVEIDQLTTSSRLITMVGEVDDTRAELPLTELLGDSTYTLRLAASNALTKLGVRTWAGIVRGDAQDFERLGACGDPRAVDALRFGLMQGRGAARLDSVEALCALGDERARQVLIDVMGDSMRALRCAAADALARLGETSWRERVRGEPGDLERLGASGDPRVFTTLAAAFARWWAAPDEGGPRSSLSTYDSGWGARPAAARALGLLGDPRANDLVSTVLGDFRAELRGAAAQALARLGEPLWSRLIRGDDEDIERLCGCPDVRVLPVVANLLWRHSSDRLVAATRHLLDTFPVDERARTIAAHALAIDRQRGEDAHQAWVNEEMGRDHK